MVIAWKTINEAEPITQPTSVVLATDCFPGRSALNTGLHSCIHSPKMSFNHSHISGRVMCSTPSVSSIELPIALKSN